MWLTFSIRRLKKKAHTQGKPDSVLKLSRKFIVVVKLHENKFKLRGLITEDTWMADAGHIKGLRSLKRKFAIP